MSWGCLGREADPTSACGKSLGAEAQWPKVRKVDSKMTNIQKPRRCSRAWATQGERALLIAWLKQGRNWLMKHVTGEARLT